MNAAEAKTAAEQRQTEVVEESITAAVSRGALEAYCQLQPNPALLANLQSRGYVVEDAGNGITRISWSQA